MTFWRRKDHHWGKTCGVDFQFLTDWHRKIEANHLVWEQVVSKVLNIDDLFLPEANLARPSLYKNILNGCTDVTSTYSRRSNLFPLIRYGFDTYRWTTTGRFLGICVHFDTTLIPVPRADAGWKKLYICKMTVD